MSFKYKTYYLIACSSKYFTTFFTKFFLNLLSVLHLPFTHEPLQSGLISFVEISPSPSFSSLSSFICFSKDTSNSHTAKSSEPFCTDLALPLSGIQYNSPLISPNLTLWASSSFLFLCLWSFSSAWNHNIATLYSYVLSFSHSDVNVKNFEIIFL